MSLGSAWLVGLSGLSTASDQMALVSRNVARAGDVDATRKVGAQVTMPGGGARLSAIARVADRVLLDGSLAATSDVGREEALSGALEELNAAVMDPELGTSPASLIANLEAELRLLSNDPSSRASGMQTIAAARAVATALGAATALVSTVRSRADTAIADAVAGLNSDLARLERLNREIVTARPDSDVTDKLDQRDAVLKSISEEIGIRIVARDGNDIVLCTDGGVVLFETVAREVSVAASGAMGPGSLGHSVVIDGVDVTGSGALMPSRSGRIAGLVEVRDRVAPTFQTQLDEIARGLIEAFADPDRSGSGKPDVPGLFTWGGGTVPASGAAVTGLASRIVVHAAVDPAQGGDLRYLRDGGASAPADPDYSANPTGAPGYSGRILELVVRLGSAQSFDPAAGLAASASVKDFASGSAGWLHELRQTTADRLEVRTAVRDRASESLLSMTGINLDQEMADLLRFEQSFQAASRLIATVDQMIKTLLEAVG